MRPSIVLAEHRQAIRKTVGLFPAANPRIFGSVLHGTDREGSDLDLLVDALPGATLFDLGGGCSRNWKRCWAYRWIC